jgi:hypothetical protein
MRVLFDQGRPVPLRQSLNSHIVTTVYEKGWSRTRNGDLLRLAEQLFEVFITTDRQLKYQQNLTDRQIRNRGIADHELAGDSKTHRQNRRSPRLDKTGLVYRN